MQEWDFFALVADTAFAWDGATFSSSYDGAAEVVWNACVITMAMKQVFCPAPGCLVPVDAN